MKIELDPNAGLVIVIMACAALVALAVVAS